MQVAPQPENEVDRLRALQEYQILDTPPEKSYDDITELATSIFQVPVALITFIDANRNWFKSHPNSPEKESPRDLSFCQHTLLQSEVLMVPDATLDPRFSDSPLVVDGPKIRFYAGAPLISPEGYVLGTLCLFDFKPRELDQKQIQSLMTLARTTVTQLELRKNIQKLGETQTQVLEHQKILAQQSKMSALGQMSSSLAHEINNPLTVILSKTERIRHILDEPNFSIEEIKSDLDKIHSTIFRISKIVRSLKAFSREGSQDPFQVVDLKAIIEDTVEICIDGLKNERIALTIELAVPQSTLVKCRGSEISQILINLIANARLAIRTESEGRWIKIQLSTTETSVEVRVKNGGTSITCEVQAKMFEPFFTTRGPGEGTGLGLSISKKLIEKNGGVLEFDPSQTDTCFLIRLPRAAYFGSK